MTKEQSAIVEITEYAEMFKNNQSNLVLIVDLAIQIYSHEDLDHLQEYQISSIIENILEEIE